MMRSLFLTLLFFFTLTLSPLTALASDYCTMHCGQDSCSRDCEGDQVAQCYCNPDGTATCTCALKPPVVQRSCDLQCTKGSCNKTCGPDEKAFCRCLYDIPDCNCVPE